MTESKKSSKRFSPFAWFSEGNKMLNLALVFMGFAILMFVGLFVIASFALNGVTVTNYEAVKTMLVSVGLISFFAAIVSVSLS